jgi:UbiD family decarboxylase
MIFEDLRDFIAESKKLGELEEVDGADWDTELGAITELAAEKRGPALLFDNIKDYPKGFRVLSNLFGSYKRSALCLGVPADLKPLQMLDVWRKKIKEFKPVPPREVRTGPVKENILTGKDVDLYKFPAPKWHEFDGGRYIGTGTSCITRDPDEGWTNLGATRCAIMDKNHFSVAIAAGHHCRMMIEKYHARGKPAPISMVLGEDPVTYYPSGITLTGWGTSEYDFSGWARGKPLDVVRGETNDLLIPATAEIVLEGEIAPPREVPTVMDGPFGEWTGHYDKGNAFVCKVTGILHRDDPIILGQPPMRPPAPWHFAIPLTAGLIWNALERADVPNVTGVWIGLEAWAPLWMSISIKQAYGGHAKQAAFAAMACRSGCYGGKYVVVVDDDIDVSDINDVMWAVMARSNVKNADIVHRVWTSAADDASYTEAQMQDRDIVSSRLIIDACYPYNHKVPLGGQNRNSQELREITLKKWSHLLARGNVQEVKYRK